MKVRSVIKVICSFLLLFSTWSSYGAEHRISAAPQHLHIHHDSDGKAHLLSSALSLFDQALMPETVAGPVVAHVFRASDIFLSAYSAQAGMEQGTFLPYLIYYHYGQYKLISAAPPLFLSTRRLLI